MEEYQKHSHIKLELKKQGNLFLAFLTITLGYFGVIANIVMYNESNNQIPYPDWNGDLIIWSYQTYLQTYFIPALILFFVCFLLTYKEDIPRYGIKHSLWFVPIIIIQSIIWYWVMYGFSGIPFLLLFGNGEGYLTILILNSINLSGALAGKKIKELVIRREKITQLVDESANIGLENN
jgi:hypothetical protein